MKALDRQAPGRHQISDPVDDARRVSRLHDEARASRRTSPPSSARPRCACTSLARRTSIPTPEQLERMRALVRAGDEGRRARRRLVADLRAGHLRRDAGADRDHDRGRQVRRHVHQPHALRRRQAARSDRRADRDQRAVRARRPKSTTSSRPGKANWGKLDAAIARVEAARARASGSPPTCTPTPAGATGLDAAMPTWVQAGGLEKWIERLKDPATRARVIAEMRTPTQGLGEPAAARRRARQGAAGRVQEPEAEAADRQDPGRGRQDARQEPGGDRDRPGHRGRQPRRHGLFPDERGQCRSGRSPCRG